MKVFDAVPNGRELTATADQPALFTKPRLDQHVVNQVDESKHNHWTLQFTHNNVPPMDTEMCLLGHVVNDLQFFI